MDNMGKIKFRYHPNIWEMGIFSKKKERERCQCCGNKTEYYLESMYCKEDVNCICVECVASGRAAEKFNGTFIQDAEFDRVNDTDKIEELTKRTPGYISWQGEYWLACCNNFCQYIGEVGINELQKMGVAEQVISDYEANNPNNYYEDCMEYLGNGLQGYLFRCLSCGRYRLWVDAD